MGQRARSVSKSILDAIFKDSGSGKSILGRIFAFFAVFHLHLSRYRADLFKKLRGEVWKIDEDEYRESFRRAEKRGQLVSVGDLGYSGSVR